MGKPLHKNGRGWAAPRQPVPYYGTRTDKFTGSLEQLKELLTASGADGEWGEIASGHQFRSYDGAKLTGSQRPNNFSIKALRKPLENSRLR